VRAPNKSVNVEQMVSNLGVLDELAERLEVIMGMKIINMGRLGELYVNNKNDADLVVHRVKFNKSYWKDNLCKSLNKDD